MFMKHIYFLKLEVKLFLPLAHRFSSELLVPVIQFHHYPNCTAMLFFLPHISKFLNSKWLQSLLLSDKILSFNYVSLEGEVK